MRICIASSRPEISSTHAPMTGIVRRSTSSMHMDTLASQVSASPDRSNLSAQVPAAFSAVRSGLTWLSCAQSGCFRLPRDAPSLLACKAIQGNGGIRCDRCGGLRFADLNRQPTVPPTPHSPGQLHRVGPN